MKKDLISIKDLSLTDIDNIFELTQRIKRQPANFNSTLCGKSIVLIFEKPSNRTRVSFEVGIWQLGAQSLNLGPTDIKLGVREALKDVARTLSRYVDAIILRTFSQKTLETFASYASIPVINGLTDLLHPCQALSDIFTLGEKWPDLGGKSIAFVGDGNNVCHSLLYICSKSAINLNIATPKKFQPQEKIVKQAKEFAKVSGSQIKLFDNAESAVRGVDVIYTDVYTSMGQEKEAQRRKKVFKHFQLNSELIAKAKTNPLIMHCLPAHRGEEITDEVIDGKNSIVFDQAENRLHVQKALMYKLLKD